jgi:hypothetical protein
LELTVDYVIVEDYQSEGSAREPMQELVKVNEKARPLVLVAVNIR